MATVLLTRRLFLSLGFLYSHRLLSDREMFAKENDPGASSRRLLNLLFLFLRSRLILSNLFLYPSSNVRSLMVSP